jgi:hypothetical protein
VSFHMHLRATRTGEVQEDFASLFRFMDTAWEIHAEEFAAGIADSICKDFGHVDDLYTMTADYGEATGAPNTLPIYGGRLVHSATKEEPPFAILDPAEVQKAAEFLQTVSFDERWRIAGAKLSRPYVDWEDKTAAKDIFLDYHNRLRTFYGQAALAGHAIIKAFWY